MKNILKKIQWLSGFAILLLSGQLQAATIMTGSASFAESSGLYSGTLFADVSGTAGNYTSTFTLNIDAGSVAVRDITLSSFMLGVDPFNFATGATSGGSDGGDPVFSLVGTSAKFEFGVPGLPGGATSSSFWFTHAELDLTGDSMLFGLFDFSNNGISNVSLTLTAVPVPAAVWLFGSGLLGLASVLRRKQG